MKKLSLLSAIICLSLSVARGQAEIEKYVKENTAKITAISPDATNYEDLAAFGNAIGNARVVMLGEQDHGDAPAFLAKTRLIKYLHEKKGFNVLAFESDFFALNYGWDELKKQGGSVDSFIKSSIYPLWTACSACSDLFYNYIPASQKQDTPLQLSGIDPQMGLAYPSRVLDSLMRGWQLPVTRDTAYQSAILPLLKSWGMQLKDTALNGRYVRNLERIRRELSQQLPEKDFWLLYIDNLIALNKSGTAKSYYERLGARDSQMAVNLEWLLRNKYPNEKIIVWAHNYHVSKDSYKYKDPAMDGASTMGSIFTGSFTDIETYILGFTSYEGTSKRLYIGNKKVEKPYKVDKPREYSFENWINREYEFAFTDFRAFNAQWPHYRWPFYLSGAVKGNLYHKNYEASWNNIFDGVFFIRKMYPCEEL
ncbi:Erythromycin esterase homolog [Chitinophaga sp. YR627]|uniref:erythromycin esterase family protein n=1 Tax=Chitinophaga sp. YR627 TaxID=1881041 RepID=UPI0008E1E272|nr:erythromycin esterase family protein [Chitinophaga sp. YR627]SFO28117.1 Erythromycin esterase homolog [Chitinophaga sp. YR627]